MTIGRLVLFSVVACVLTACEHVEESRPDPKAVDVLNEAPEKPRMNNHEVFDAADQKACADFGGTYARAGILGFYFCFVDYADAGKACLNSGECEGKCVATDTSSEPPSGVCQSSDNPFGCYTELRGDPPYPTICVD